MKSRMSGRRVENSVSFSRTSSRAGSTRWAAQSEPEEDDKKLVMQETTQMVDSARTAPNEVDNIPMWPR